VSTQSDERLEATLSSLRDELAWFWALCAIGEALDGEPMPRLDDLVVNLPGDGPVATAGGEARRMAHALGQSLASAVRSVLPGLARSTTPLI